MDENLLDYRLAENTDLVLASPTTRMINWIFDVIFFIAILAALEMMLFSLGRTQTVLVGEDDVKAALYKDLHIEWSKTLQKQLMTK